MKLQNRPAIEYHVLYLHICAGNAREHFKKFGGDKAYYAEDNYAAYLKKNEPVAKELSKISNNYGLKKIGGLDTHIKDIFSSK